MAKFGLSQSIRRVEDPRLLKGDGQYTADISLAGEAQGVVRGCLGFIRPPIWLPKGLARCLASFR